MVDLVVVMAPPIPHGITMGAAIMQRALGARIPAEDAVQAERPSDGPEFVTDLNVLPQPRLLPPAGLEHHIGFMRHCLGSWPWFRSLRPLV